jgi:hypothetical protein
MLGGLVVMMFFLAGVFGGTARQLDRVGESTVHFGRQSGCATSRVTMPDARLGDAVQLEQWRLPDGSFVHAEVTRDGTVEVERCACGAAGAVAVRLRVVRSAGRAEGRARARSIEESAACAAQSKGGAT